MDYAAISWLDNWLYGWWNISTDWSLNIRSLTLLISWCICLFPPSPAQLITFLVIMFWLIIGKLMPLLYTFLSSYVQTSISRYISSAVQSIVKSADGCIIHLRLNLFYYHLVLRLFIKVYKSGISLPMINQNIITRKVMSWAGEGGNKQIHQLINSVRLYSLIKPTAQYIQYTLQLVNRWSPLDWRIIWL
jgi:hypothetical protein